MLQQRGYAVVLIDRKLPASETSGGNAGIIGDSAAVPFNNPGLRRELGHLLFGKSAALRYDWHYVSARMPWLVRFFVHTNAASAKHRTLLLHQLICRSQTLHRRWMTTCRLAEQLRKSGGLNVIAAKTDGLTLVMSALCGMIWAFATKCWMPGS